MRETFHRDFIAIAHIGFDASASDKMAAIERSPEFRLVVPAAMNEILSCNGEEQSYSFEAYAHLPSKQA